jgi:hypothetical protein
MPVPELGIPRVVDQIHTILFIGEEYNGRANIFTHTHGVGPSYRLGLNSKGISPYDVGLEVDNSPWQMKVGYGYAIHYRRPYFTYWGDAFGFATTKKAAADAKRHFDGVLSLFAKHKEKKVRRHVARTGKLTFFPGVYE